MDKWRYRCLDCGSTGWRWSPKREHFNCHQCFSKNDKILDAKTGERVASVAAMA